MLFYTKIYFFNKLDQHQYQEFLDFIQIKRDQSKIEIIEPSLKMITNERIDEELIKQWLSLHQYSGNVIKQEKVEENISAPISINYLYNFDRQYLCESQYDIVDEDELIALYDDFIPQEEAETQIDSIDDISLLKQRIMELEYELLNRERENEQLHCIINELEEKLEEVECGEYQLRMENHNKKAKIEILTKENERLENELHQEKLHQETQEIAEYHYSMFMDDEENAQKESDRAWDELFWLHNYNSMYGENY